MFIILVCFIQVCFYNWTYYYQACVLTNSEVMIRICLLYPSLSGGMYFCRGQWVSILFDFFLLLRAEDVWLTDWELVWQSNLSCFPVRHEQAVFDGDDDDDDGLFAIVRTIFGFTISIKEHFL
jgi:hypothetical protein